MPGRKGRKKRAERRTPTPIAVRVAAGELVPVAKIVTKEESRRRSDFYYWNNERLRQLTRDW